jgi:curved DNA-binding protein CbpA
MSDPYAVLGVSPEADDAAIRRRYLELVRQFPPERAPDRFAEIRAAFDEVRDPLRRIERRLLSWQTQDTLGALAGDVRARLRQSRLSLDALMALAEES